MNNDKPKTDLQEQMDKAAAEAEKEFQASWTAVDVAKWWKKWFIKAGHKRLGRVLVRIAG